MVNATAWNNWDYSGTCCLTLRHRGKPVVAATMRVFGTSLAEVPLVATRFAARRQGHCRVLFAALEAQLAALGVRYLSLPAAHETVDTWRSGFGFRDMPDAALQAVRQELRVLLFPGTEVLYKPLGGSPPLCQVRAPRARLTSDATPAAAAQPLGRSFQSPRQRASHRRHRQPRTPPPLPDRWPTPARRWGW